MLVSELKDILKDYQEEELRLLAVELYKAMPKGVKEDKEIDTLVREGKELLHKKKGQKAPKKPVDINSLKEEIEEFIANAYQQNYFAPNRVIPKKERPKWRFKVKAYVKDLQSVPAEGPEGLLAAELLGKLYTMVAYSCSYYLFSTEDPFRSVGIGQSEFLEIALTKRFAHGLDREAVKAGFNLTMAEGMDRETLEDELFHTLIMTLKTPDAKEMALEETIKQKEELDAGWRAASGGKKRSYGYSSAEFGYKEKGNHLVELALLLYLALCDYDEGIAYFKKNYQGEGREILLYVLLRYLYFGDLKEYWVREYEEAVKKKIKPRESLQKVYTYIKENGEFPEYYYM